MTLTWPPTTLGTIIAGAVLIAVLILSFLHMIDVSAALLIAAVCSFKL